MGECFLIIVPDCTELETQLFDYTATSNRLTSFPISFSQSVSLSNMNLSQDSFDSFSALLCSTTHRQVEIKLPRPYLFIVVLLRLPLVAHFLFFILTLHVHFYPLPSVPAPLIPGGARHFLTSLTLFLLCQNLSFRICCDRTSAIWRRVSKGGDGHRWLIRPTYELLTDNVIIPWL